MGRRLLALLLGLLAASVGLAGCADDPGTDEDRGESPAPSPSGAPDQPDPGGSRALVAGAKPVWYQGLQWTYDVDSPEVGLAAPLTLVVVGEDESDWHIAPTNDSDPDAIMWSLFWHLPPLGAVDKEAFAPQIHGVSVAWFDWPLRDGKSWQAEDHHGTPVNYTVALTQATLFDGRDVAAFEVVGERSGAAWLRYVYTAEVAWFVTAEVDGDGDGVFDHRVTLTDVRPGAAHLSTPTFEAIDLATLQDQDPQSILEPATSFTVPTGTNAVYAFFVLGGGPGRYTGSVTLPSGSVQSFNFTNTNQTPMAVVRGAAYEATAGEGNVGSMILGQGFVFAELFAVKRSGT